MPRDWKFRIKDILRAIEKIEEYTAGCSEESFLGDSKTIDAVIKNLEVIGEATNHIPASLKGKYPKLPWLEMSGMRNILVHEYFGVSSAVVWKTVRKDIPGLKADMAKLLSEVAD